MFAVVTQLQFNTISEDKIYAARLETFRSNERAYDAAVVTYEACITSIETRESYRGIFAGISKMFEETAELPVNLFPDSPEAAAYQLSLNQSIQDLILGPIALNLPSKTLDDCAPIPIDPPVRPER